MFLYVKLRRSCSGVPWQRCCTMTSNENISSSNVLFEFMTTLTTLEIFVFSLIFFVLFCLFFSHSLFLFRPEFERHRCHTIVTEPAQILITGFQLVIDELWKKSGGVFLWKCGRRVWWNRRCSILSDDKVNTRILTSVKIHSTRDCEN